MDFSPAFNTVSIDKLLHHPSDLQVHPTLILWTKSFLLDRPQPVYFNGVKSTKLILNTGLPQGCVLSPILFSVYTNNILCHSEGMALLKYADDIALVAHMANTDTPTRYLEVVNNLAQTFVELSLELGRGGRDKASPLFQPVSIQGQLVEQVQVLRYLGIEMDTSLSYSQHADTTYKKAQLLLHLLRNISGQQGHFNFFYRSLIESVLTFNIASWYNQLTIKHKTKLTRIVNQAVFFWEKKTEFPELRKCWREIRYSVWCCIEIWSEPHQFSDTLLLQLR